MKSITGRGVQAQVDGEAVDIGKPVLFSEIAGAAMPGHVDDANHKLIAGGRTTMSGACASLGSVGDGPESHLKTRATMTLGARLR